jgi:hypothetical protein
MIIVEACKNSSIISHIKVPLLGMIVLPNLFDRHIVQTQSPRLSKHLKCRIVFFEYFEDLHSVSYYVLIFDKSVCYILTLYILLLLLTLLTFSKQMCFFTTHSNADGVIDTSIYRYVDNMPRVVHSS